MPDGNTSVQRPASEGMFFEDFEVGRIYAHRLGRTVIDADNAWFSLITLGINQVHFNDDYASRTPFGKSIVPSPFTLAVVTGISATEFGQNTVANLGWMEVELPKPVVVGDTIYARSKVLSKRESASRPYAGIVEVQSEGFNQDGVIVLTFRRKLMVYRQGHSPSAKLPVPVGSAL